MMIPRIIHQTWKSTNIPSKFVPYQTKVKQLHPDWKYCLWTDDDNAAFVQKNFPRLHSIYKEFPRNIMRADMIRYLIMNNIGGVYLDLDYEMIKPFDLLNYSLVLPYNRNKNFGDAYDGFGNCIFGSAPGHPFWNYVLNDLEEKRDYEKFYKTLFSAPYITRLTTMEEAITGPGLLSRVFYSYRAKLRDYFLPPRELFHPEIPRNNKQYQEVIAKNISYGIHHSCGTWRDKSVFTKIRNKIQWMYSKN